MANKTFGENTCPGSANISGTPTLAVKHCPECGAEVELFSTDSQVTCKCGFVVYNNIQSCIKWCRKARECVGEEKYMELMKYSSKSNE
jgi:hypothetical protein